MTAYGAGEAEDGIDVGFEMSQSFIEFIDGNIASHFTKLGPSSFRRRGRVSCQLVLLALPSAGAGAIIHVPWIPSP